MDDCCTERCLKFGAQCRGGIPPPLLAVPLPPNVSILLASDTTLLIPPSVSIGTILGGNICAAKKDIDSSSTPLPAFWPVNGLRGDPLITLLFRGRRRTTRFTDGGVCSCAIAASCCWCWCDKEGPGRLLFMARGNETGSEVMDPCDRGMPSPPTSPPPSPPPQPVYGPWRWLLLSPRG